MKEIIREYRSHVFALLYNNKKEALSLYNAVNGTRYENYEDVEINTLVDENGAGTGILARMKNDVSFIFEDYDNFYEHQSKVNENMPTRYLLYLAEQLKRDIPSKALLRQKGYRLPTPVFIVFYNGDEKVPEQYEMRLSDLYEKKVEEPALELIVKVYNINEGCNEGLVKACRSLGQFAEFSSRVKRTIGTATTDAEKEQAVRTVVDECIREGILPEFLEKYKEVIVDDYLIYTKEDYDWAYTEDLKDQNKELTDEVRNLTEQVRIMAESVKTLTEQNRIMTEQVRTMTEQNNTLRSRLARYEPVEN